MSTRLALPILIDFISVPVSTMPAVYVSMKKYSNAAFLLRMLTGLFLRMSCSSLFIFFNGCKAPYVLVNVMGHGCRPLFLVLHELVIEVVELGEPLEQCHELLV